MSVSLYAFQTDWSDPTVSQDRETGDVFYCSNQTHTMFGTHRHMLDNTEGTGTQTTILYITEHLSCNTLGLSSTWEH